MVDNIESVVVEICRRHGGDRGRLMDVATEVQSRFGCVPSKAMDVIARELSTSRVEVEGLVSFYSFLSSEPKGRVIIRLCNDVIDRMHGVERVGAAFEEELGIGFGDTTPDGAITLEHTACIGMSDQAPAALVNDVVVTNLSSDAAREIVRGLRSHMDPSRLVHKLGDGNNAHPLVRAMVNNNVRRSGPVVLADMPVGAGLSKALAMSPAEVIRAVNTARLRGRGGAGFPTGMKWEFTRKAPDGRRFIVCNADEGEPGTFKDRVILTEQPDLLIEGITIAGYAVGSDTGILYLRQEYAYLRRFLEHVLEERRRAGLLGKSICGREGFNFDIRIQMGAGAYVCGEETALISSCEGRRGDPKNRPPFPAEKGYLGKPTVVNNVETFCCAARILEKGAGWFAQLGSQGSTGTKLLSVSGDCTRPGVYEVPFGIPLRELLELCDARDPGAVQVGGPSGQMVGPESFGHRISYDELATGGSVMVFSRERDVLEVVESFLDFFIDESCGYCTPCRVGNVLLKERIGRIRAGKGTPGDLDYLMELGETIRATSRCGLGQTSPNPVLSTLAAFRSAYEELVRDDREGFQPSFDMRSAIAESVALAGRESTYVAD